MNFQHVLHQVAIKKKSHLTCLPQYTQADFAISVQVGVKPDLSPSSGH